MSIRGKLICKSIKLSKEINYVAFLITKTWFVHLEAPKYWDFHFIFLTKSWKLQWYVVDLSSTQLKIERIVLGILILDCS